MASLLVILLQNKMEEGRRNNFLNLLTLLQILSIVNGSGDAFQRIDKNDEGNTVVGLTRFFHQCSIDSGCNFVVKKNEDSELEKLQNVDDVTKYYNVWKRLKKQGRLLITIDNDFLLLGMFFCILEISSHSFKYSPAISFVQISFITHRHN